MNLSSLQAAEQEELHQWHRAEDGDESDHADAIAIEADDFPEVLVETDDEADIQKLEPRCKRVKNFHHRQAYQNLAKHGLVEIPSTLPRIGLMCHKTTNCWQGVMPDVHSGLSFTWGGGTGRTEEAALLKSVKGILTAFTHRFPRERLWNLGCQI